MADWRNYLTSHKHKLLHFWHVMQVSIIVGLPLIAIGALGVRHWEQGGLHSISEAVFVAGLIVFCVDPFVKGELLKEFAKDLFPYMIGFDLPQQIKDRLRDIVNNCKLYREHMEMDLFFSGTGADVKIRIESRFDLVNPTSAALPYTHQLEFEEAENTDLVKLGVPGKERLEFKSLDYSSSGVCKCAGQEISIKPNGESSKSQQQYPFTSEYSQTYRKTGFHLQTFGRPTIGFTLTLKENGIQGIEVLASPRKGHENEECEELKQGVARAYDELFMKGDSINIRWRPKKHAASLIPVSSTGTAAKNSGP